MGWFAASWFVSSLPRKRFPVGWLLLFLGMASMNAVLWRGKAGFHTSQAATSSHAPPPPRLASTTALRRRPKASRL